MRDPDMYGQDSDSFRPEQWLDVLSEQRREWDIYDFHWGYGNRLCMGKHIAIMDIYEVTFEVLPPLTPFCVKNGSLDWLSSIRIC